ncbi:MAG: hypothetical protein K2X86_19090 [Cytophagaceae bacterium]|nr:hypothetical protein [Cytophagaceae bacterium]
MKKYFYIITVMIFAQHAAIAFSLKESDSISPATERQVSEVAKKFIREHRMVNFIQPVFKIKKEIQEFKGQKFVNVDFMKMENLSMQ